MLLQVYDFHTDKWGKPAVKCGQTALPGFALCLLIVVSGVRICKYANTESHAVLPPGF